MGSNYWKEQGATLIAHTKAYKEIQHRSEDIYVRALRIQKDKIIGTKVALLDQTFEDKMTLNMGSIMIELLRLGASHSPDDTQLWLPSRNFDMAFNERMLSVFVYTDTAAWIKAWGKLEALKPEITIPGHGAPTDLAIITKFTKDYLVYMHT